jgi:hypothetical protein
VGGRLVKIGNRNHPLRTTHVDRYLGDRLEPAPGVGLRTWGRPLSSDGIRVPTSEAIDRMARTVMQMPPFLSIAERKRLRLIARELLRRARLPKPHVHDLDQELEEEIS